MHRTSVVLELTLPTAVEPPEGLIEKVEDLLPAGSTVEVMEQTQLEEDIQCEA
jgi:hypothetical protein